MGKPVGDPSKTTRWAWSKQTPDGILSSGALAEDRVKHAWQLMNSYDPRHYIVLDADGARKSRTTLEAPGGLHVKVGQDMERTPSQPGPYLDGLQSRGNNTLAIQVENGNLNIDIQNGDLNIRARNINMACADDDADGGNLTIVSNGTVDILGKRCKLFALEDCTVQGTQMLRVVGYNFLQMESGICQMISNSTRRGKKPDIYNPDIEVEASYSQPVSGTPYSGELRIKIITLKQVKNSAKLDATHY